MTMNMLACATSLTDRELLARLPQLAANERRASAELIAHLVALEMRPDVYAAEGYGSLFAYCTRALRLSEDAACTRTAAVAVCRRFPQVLALLLSGELNLTAVRRIGPHLTPGNCDSVLARAVNQSRSQIEILVAELAPQPDVQPSVRKVPVRSAAPPAAPVPGAPEVRTSADLLVPTPAPVSAPPPRRPVVQPSAPERYRVQFTIGSAAHEKLRRVQALLRREIPSGDPGLLFERALDLLLAKMEKEKLGKTTQPRKRSAIRSETDKPDWDAVASSRHIPNEVKRIVWERDAGCCAFVSTSGHRCGERSFLEFHHLIPYALGGQPTPGNIALRCRRHNQYEARQVFGESSRDVGRSGAAVFFVKGSAQGGSGPHR
jgi:hypothetical protein